MINDLTELFKKGYEKYGDKMILDIYKPKEGLYLRINKDRTIDKLVIDKKVNIDDELYKWFRDRDYYSCLIEMNKSVDPQKQIHSNNCFTVFMKKDIFPEVGEDGKAISKQLFFTYLKNYFEVLKNPEAKFKNDKKVIELYKTISTPVLAEYDLLKKFIEEKFDLLIEQIKGEDFKIYIKIFLDRELSDYVIEGERYVIPKIFNDNGYNQKIGNCIMGLSNNNMGMNSKKPFLELRTTKFKVPYRINVNGALLGKKIFDWLNYQDSTEILIPSNYEFSESLPPKSSINGSCYFIHISRGITVTIDDFDFIPEFNNNIRFEYKNYLGDDNAKDAVFNTLDGLEGEFDKCFFNGSMRNSYYMEPSKIRIKGMKYSEKVKNLLIINRKVFHNYFRKGIKNVILSRIDSVSSDLLMEHFWNDETLKLTKTINAFNLRLSLLEFFKIGECDMADAIGSLLAGLREKAKCKNEKYCESEKEFYFAAGQLAQYILSKSKAQRRKLSILDPFFKAKTGIDFKKHLNDIVEYYSHALSDGYLKFRKVLAMVEGYETESTVNDYKDIFMAGYLSENIFFEMKEAK